MILYTAAHKEYVGRNARAFSLADYMGKWYDVAHKPFKYQAPCQAQSTATYRLLPGSNKVEVTNRCGANVSKGLAEIAKDGDPMRLQVSFGQGQPPGEYWVVMVDSHRYRWSVVSNSSKSLLWILSRKRSLKPSILNMILQLLRERGYQVDDLEYASKFVWVTRDLEAATVKNSAFRHVVATGPRLQVVLMALTAGQEIGAEVHPETDQFFRLEKGRAILRYKYKETDTWTDVALSANAAFLIPAGTWHNVIAVDALSLYTIYAPPEH